MEDLIKTISNILNINQCSICNKPILFGEYYMDNSGNNAHASHDGVKTIPCKSCGVLTINSSTSKCLYCSDLVEIKPEQINQCFFEVCHILKKEGIIINQNNIKSIKLVAKSYFSNPLQQGETFTEVYTIANYKRYSHNINIVKGVSILAFKGVIAHELAHTWLNENECNLEDYQTIGFCNIASFLVYKNDRTSQAIMLINSLNEDNSNIYGKGYAFMKSIVDNYGLEKLIQRILLTSKQ